MLAGISSIDVTGPLSLAINLSAPDPVLPLELTQYYGIGDVISPKALADPSALTSANPSAGAGPYVYDPTASVVGDHYTYRARSGYFDLSRQRFTTIVIRVIANSQAAVNALSTGQVDVVVQGDPSTVSQVKAAGGHVTAVPFVWIGLDLLDRGGTTDRALADVRVRQAINYAVDRPLLTRAVLGPYGVPTDETVLPGADGWSAAAAGRYAYDPGKARELLAEAGYPKGLTIPVASIDLDGLNTMGQALAGQLAKVGINLQIETLSLSASSLTALLDRQYPAAVVAYGAQPIYLEDQGLFGPKASEYNAFGTDSPDLDGLVASSLSAAPSQQSRIDQQIEEYLVDQAWFVPVAFGPVLTFSRPGIGGVTVTSRSPVSDPLDWYRTQP
jgi:peptide/nickel transport system substrate-binding protein